MRLELRVGGRTISTPVAASSGYDAASQEVQLGAASGNERALEPCSVTLQLDEPPPGAETAVAHLVEAETGRELARSAPIAIRLSL